MGRGILFHGAGIIRNGRCYLFLGQSGSGKSTICTLTKNAEIIDDNEVFVKGIRNRFFIQTSDNKDFYKIVRIFFIFRSRKNLVKRFSFKEALKIMLTDSIIEFKLSWFKKDLENSRYLFNFAVSFLQSVPYYRIYFRKDRGIWEVIDRLESQHTLPGSLWRGGQ